MNKKNFHREYFKLALDVSQFLTEEKERTGRSKTGITEQALRLLRATPKDRRYSSERAKPGRIAPLLAHGAHLDG